MLLNAVLKKAQFICRKENQDLNALEAHVVAVDGALSSHRELSLLDSNGSIDANDLEQLHSLSKVFGEIISAMKQLITLLPFSPTMVAKNCCSTTANSSPETPKFQIPPGVLENLHSLSSNAWQETGFNSFL